MKIIECYEYYICYEEKLEDSSLKYEAICCITTQSPITGWIEVFKALNESGKLKNVFRIQNAQCSIKQICVGDDGRMIA